MPDCMVVKGPTDSPGSFNCARVECCAECEKVVGAAVVV